MRLIHHELIPHLPRLQLLHMHRVCCGIRGRAWVTGKSTTVYIYRHPWDFLYHYHTLILDEMEARGYKPDYNWRNRVYRGRVAKQLDLQWYPPLELGSRIYPEHTEAYKDQCIRSIMNKIYNNPGIKKYSQEDNIRFAKIVNN